MKLRTEQTEKMVVKKKRGDALYMNRQEKDLVRWKGGDLRGVDHSCESLKLTRAVKKRGRIRERRPRIGGVRYYHNKTNQIKKLGLA